MTAFDTNVLIYCCDQNEPRRQERAFEILAAAENGVLLWQVAVEFVAASRKLAPQGFTAAHAWARLREFLDLLTLVVPLPESSKLLGRCIRTREFRSGMPWSLPLVSIVE